MKDTLRVGIIGTGVMGQDHARNLAGGVGAAKVVALADVNQPVTQALADELGGAAVFTDGKELIQSGLVDSVIIAAPDRFHADLTIACLDQRLPVLVEKPLAPTIAEASTVLDRCREVATPLVTVGFMRRFDPGYRALKQRLAEGVDGKLLMTHSIHRNVEAYPGGNSAATISNSAIHEIDILPWLSGSPIVEVLWSGGLSTSLLPDRHDPKLVLLRDASGVLHSVEVMVHARYGYDVRCEVVCEQACVELPRVPSLVEGDSLEVNANLGRSVSYPADWRPRFAAAYRAELSAWVTATCEGRLPEGAATVEEALRATVVAESLITSMQHGSWVKVPA